MIKILLYPLSLIYGLIVYIRNMLYDTKIFKSTEFEIPVISIGNITVGGTGKTPHTEYLVELLKKHVKVATLSRGYKRKSKGFVAVQETSDVQNVGDEPLQIKRKYPEVTVAVDENRVHGIQQLMKDENPDVILLDDAFQHRKVTAGINILLIDYNRPIEEDHLLPMGRLRERAHHRRRANIIIYTKCPDEITPITRRIIMKNVNLRPYQSLYFTTMVYGEAEPVFPELATERPEMDGNQTRTVMLSGIANPSQFRKYLAAHSNLLDEIVFSDHHNFTKRDYKQIEDIFAKYQAENSYLLTTEKDAVRLRFSSELSDELKAKLFYIPVKIHFLDSEGKSFNKKIVGYVKDNRSNRRLHQQNHW
ncbi:tetraacyldisaccharide 4'-kinase [Mangrovibacterium marinum]|uniref:Tetraacyldisaccharide 4'-kinase n=1 Tax=Mangrovibacterium marinum TaxID=1639118 RepID=A0A2T5C157_9BACT|nr:tetraacyldisaccharide 4'-kinase [Mangrovibacterium marinum]PTN08358.1 lipid-A-disaccharide kinase [Mangrovibacterium marinum]